MTVRDIEKAIEKIAPLSLQDGFDNAGLQVGCESAEVSGVLVCLDVTEDIINEAFDRKCDMIVSHHPLLFSPLKRVSDFTYQQRCVCAALTAGVSIYSAHTNLDNARGGVNFKMAEKIGLKDLQWLEEKPGADAGSGLIGDLPEEVGAEEFLLGLKDIFEVKALAYSDVPSEKKISKVALCGGAGAFLIPKAQEKGADAFVTGEIRYHEFFENEGMLLAALGHYESEQFTIDLIADIIQNAFPHLKVEKAWKNTNPIRVK